MQIEMQRELIKILRDKDSVFIEIKEDILDFLEPGADARILSDKIGATLPWNPDTQIDVLEICSKILFTDRLFSTPIRIEEKVIRDRDFSGLRLTSNIQFRQCIFSDVDFSNGKLAGVRFPNCHFQDVSFAKSDLTNAMFDRCQLTNVSFEGSTLERTYFQHATLKEVNFKGSQGLNTLRSSGMVADDQAKKALGQY